MNVERVFRVLFISSVFCFVSFLCLCFGRCSFCPKWIQDHLLIAEIPMLIFFAAYLLFLPAYVWKSLTTGWKKTRLFLLSLLFIAPTAFLTLWLLSYLFNVPE